MAMDDSSALPARADMVNLAKQLLVSGAEAPKVAVNASIRALGKGAYEYYQARPTDRADAVKRIIRAHTLLARGEGLAAATAVTAAETTSIIGSAGTLTLPTAVIGVMADLAGLSWIQVRMVLHIAALHGFDPTDPARLKEVLFIMGIGAPTVEAGAAAAGAHAEKFLRRLTLKHLKGEPLKAVKAMFKAVNINFTRTGLLKGIGYVNIPVSVAVNGKATKMVGKRADAYYADMAAALG